MSILKTEPTTGEAIGLFLMIVPVGCCALALPDAGVMGISPALFFLTPLVPTLRVGTHVRTLRVPSLRASARLLTNPPQSGAATAFPRRAWEREAKRFLPPESRLLLDSAPRTH